MVGQRLHLYTFFESARFYIEFHVLSFPGSSRAHHDVRFEKSVTTARFRVQLSQLMPFIYGQWFLLFDKRRFLHH
jgi:hypothetical protein